MLFLQRIDFEDPRNVKSLLWQIRVICLYRNQNQWLQADIVCFSNTLIENLETTFDSFHFQFLINTADTGKRFVSFLFPFMAVSGNDRVGGKRSKNPITNAFSCVIVIKLTFEVL
jgi:hypothetical protein